MDIKPIPSEHAWELEYQNPQLLTKDQEPTKAFRDFVNWLAKDQDIDLRGKRVLDLGCGTGRNLIYLHENYGAVGVGVDISSNALRMAKEKAPELDWVKHDLNNPLPEFESEFDLVIDSTTSHLLGAEKRSQMVASVADAVSKDALLYVRTLTKDGDRNAHNLIKNIPGPEKDSYIHPNLGIAEYVLSEQDLLDLYGSRFEVLHKKKYTGYQRWGVQSYKRRYFLMYLKKK